MESSNEKGKRECAREKAEREYVCVRERDFQLARKMDDGNLDSERKKTRFCLF